MLTDHVKHWQHKPTRDDTADTHLDGEELTSLSGPPPRPLAWLYYSLAAAPTLAFATVWAFSWRVSTIMGRWPLVMHDDPKFAAPGDLLSTFLYFSVFPFILWSVVGVFLLPILTFLFRRSYAPRRLGLGLVFFAVTVALMRMDPGLRFTWLAD